jgi:predicted metal-dependent hydrolase
MSGNDQFQRGIELFNSEEFFRAHEVWEEIWLMEGAPEKTFLQGLIQAAAAFHHYTRGNLSGAQSLLASAAAKLKRFPADHRGIASGKLRERVVWWAHSLGQGTDPGRGELPRIHGV